MIGSNNIALIIKAMNKSVVNQRLSTEFHRLFSLLLQRFEWTLPTPISLTRVEVSPDLRWAHIYFTTAESVKPEEVLQQLKDSKKQWKHRLAKQWKHRHMPDLIFHYDHVSRRTSAVAQILADWDEK